MSVLDRNPVNTNPLQPTKFLLTFNRLKNTTYFCQAVNIPAISLGEVVRSTPFIELYSPGTKLTFDPLDITFLLTEELDGWTNLYDWFKDIASADGYEGRNGPIQQSEIQGIKTMSDATLTILNNLNNPILRIEFTNCFPTNMSGINLNTTLDADTILTCDATFRYQSYRYLPA